MHSRLTRFEIAFHIVACLVISVVFLDLAGCASTGESSAVTTTPPAEDLKAVHLSLGIVGGVADTDDNRFPDTITVMMILRGNHPVSITPAGTFTFTLYTDDDTEVVRWELSEESVLAAVAHRKLVGPSFMFRLNIRDHLSSDKMQAVSLSLAATFSPTVGDPIRSGGRRHVMFGRDG